MSKSLGIAAAMIVSILVVEAAADTEGVVPNRQREMEEIASAAKSLAAMFKSPKTYASTNFGQAAKVISDRADQRLVDHFSTNVSAEGSKATEAIAIDSRRFAELAAELKTYADVLANAAVEHPGAMTDDMRMKEGELMEGGLFGSRRKKDASAMSAEHAFHMMLQTCTSCHSKFRAK